MGSATAVNTLMATNAGAVRFAEENPSVGEAMANLLPGGVRRAAQ